MPRDQWPAAMPAPTPFRAARQNATSPGRPSSPSTWRNWLWAFCATYYCRGHSGMNCGDRSLGFSERQAVTLLLGLARGRRAAAVTIEMA